MYLNYKPYSAIADLHTFQFRVAQALFVSWQRISTQKLSFQIIMKSSCHFFFNQLWIPTQSPSSNSPTYVVLDSILYGPNLYSTNLLKLFPLSVSWQRIYNSPTVNKSSNHTLSLHRPTSNSSSTTDFPTSDLRRLTTELRWLLQVYPLGTDHAQKAQPLHSCKGMFTLPLPSNRNPIFAWRGPHRKQCHIIAFWNVFTEPLPGNASQYGLLQQRRPRIFGK
jgi:hypothetical protein